MKYSKLFGKSLRESPKDASLVSHKYLVQGGFIRESVAGRYFFLPLGLRVRRKIEKIVREEMNKIGAQEMITPVLHPLELWEETNRTESVNFELMQIQDRRGGKFALGGTAEEMFVDVVRKFQISYKDLPFTLYQFSEKFRDEKRARGGLLRAREFLMKDAYSFHKDEEDFEIEYKNQWNAYETIFSRVGLQSHAVAADGGYIGGDYCHEFIVESEVGESRYLESDDGSYKAHEDIAVFTKENKNLEEESREMIEVEAVRGKTMEDGVRLHKLPDWQQIKDVVFVDEKNRFILAIIRGELDVNEVKLMNVTGANQLRHASDEEIRESLQSEPGFISPVGIKDNLSDDVNLLIVADESLRTIKNAYGGANKLNKDLLNVNIDRDYKPDIEGDIAMAQPGYLAPNGISKLIEKRGVEVGNIFQLGYHYTNKMKESVFVDEDGNATKYYMGCYGIGIGRTMATVVEIHHDNKGIIWPFPIAPFSVHLINLGNNSEIDSKANEIYQTLIANNIEVLWDDRNETAGVKFADSDLIGNPIRLVISEKSLQKGGIEIKERNSTDYKIVEIEKLLEQILTIINQNSQDS
jgi:prolyl-tRNA synthetase